MTRREEVLRKEASNFEESMKLMMQRLTVIDQRLNSLEVTKPPGVQGVQEPGNMSIQPGVPLVLETDGDRRRFTQSLRGKRVLHVKGFGSSFKDPTTEQQGIQDDQRRVALLALQVFNPEFVVVDGDPWGGGFQVYMKDYIDDRKPTGQVPTLIWAKNVKLAGDDGHIADPEEKAKREKQAREWADQGFPTVVYWLDADRLSAKIEQMYGDGFVEKHKEAKSSKRGLVTITSGSGPSWTKGVNTMVRNSVASIESDTRGDKQYFEKCSFENSAKGNLIFDLMHEGAPAKHGVICFGGGESVLLEIATKHLHKDSDVVLEDVAVFPFSRGREGQDPELPKYVGSSFNAGSPEAAVGATGTAVPMKAVKSEDSPDSGVRPAWSVEGGLAVQEDEETPQAESLSEVKQRLAELVKKYPFLEPSGNTSGHALLHWVRRCRDAIQKGQADEATRHLNRIKRGLEATHDELKGSFERFDIDNSGYLDMEEYKYMCAYLSLGTEEAKAIIPQVEKDKDVKISLNDFEIAVGRMGGMRKIFEKRRERVNVSQWGVHESTSTTRVGNRVRAHFYVNGKRSKGWREAQVLATKVKDECKDAPTDGVTVAFGFEDDDWVARQVVPPSFIVSGSDDSQVAQALREVGIIDEQQSFWGSIFPEHELRAMARLSTNQRNALRSVRQQATKLHADALPEVLQHFQALGFGQKELSQCLSWIEGLAPTVVHVHIDNVGRFMEVDDYYRNQFETHTSCGALDDGNEIRVGWEKELFGGNYDKAKAFERPKYGALSVMNDYRGVTSAMQYGDSYLVLKNVRLRCTFAATDSGGIAGTRLGVLDKYAHILKEYNDEELKGLIKVAVAAHEPMENAGVSPQLLRGTTVDSSKEWITLGFPDLKQQKGCFFYEMQLEEECQSPQVGLLSEGFQCKPKVASAQGVGDDAHGWSVDGLHSALWHKAANRAWRQTWANKGNVLGERTVVGVAVDLDNRRLWFATNGIWDETPAFDDKYFQGSGPGLYPAISVIGRGAFNFGPNFEYGPPKNGLTFEKWPGTPPGSVQLTSPRVGNSDILSCYKEIQIHGEVNLNRNVQRLVANMKYKNMPKSQRSWSLNVAGAGLCSGTYRRTGAIGDYAVYTNEAGAIMKVNTETMRWQMHESKETAAIFASAACEEGSYQPPRKGWAPPDEVLGVVNADFFNKALIAKGISQDDINKLSAALAGKDSDGNPVMFKVRGNTSLADEWEKLPAASATSADVWAAAVAGVQNKLLEDSGFANAAVVDSGHPYPSKRHEWTKDVYLKGADQIIVHFASKTRTLDYRTQLTILAGPLSRATAGPGTRVHIQTLGGRYNSENMRGHILEKAEIKAGQDEHDVHWTAVIDKQDIQNSYHYQVLLEDNKDDSKDDDKSKSQQFLCTCVKEQIKHEVKYEDGKKISDEISGFTLDRSNVLTPISIAGFCGAGPAQAEGVQQGWFLDIASLLESSSSNTLRELEGDDLGEPPGDMRSALSNLDKFMKRLDKFRECSDITLSFTNGVEGALMPSARITYSSGTKVGDEITSFVNYGDVCINEFKAVPENQEGEPNADSEEAKDDSGTTEKATEDAAPAERPRKVASCARDAGVRAGWRVDIEETLKASEPGKFSEDSIRSDPSSLLDMSDVTLVFEPSNVYDVSYFSSSGGTEYNPDAWQDVHIPNNSCSLKFHSDGDSTDSADKRWGVFALVLPNSSKPDKKAIDALADKWSVITSKAEGIDADGISVEPADWDEQRLRALCKKRNWEFEWMSDDGERRRRIGERSSENVGKEKPRKHDTQKPDNWRPAPKGLKERKRQATALNLERK